MRALVTADAEALLTGKADHVDDLNVAGALWAAFVRSPVPHARIRSVDVGPARAGAGVVAAFDGRELRDEWAAPMPCLLTVGDVAHAPEQWPLAQDEARYAGEPVAVVVGETRQAVADAVRAVTVDLDELPAHVDLDVGADDADGRHAFTWCTGTDEAALARAFADAAHVVEERYEQPRLAGPALTPRAVLVEPGPGGRDGRDGRDVLVRSATALPDAVLDALAATCGVDRDDVRGEVSALESGFGSELALYPELATCLAVCRRLGRPVRWSEERPGAAVGTVQGRGQCQYVSLAADRLGRVTGLRVRLVADLGAYLQVASPPVPLLGALVASRVYEPAAWSFSCTGVLTNRPPTGALRGSGRAEAVYAVERAMDALSREVGLDPAELRRRNYARRESRAGVDHEGMLRHALDLVAYDELRAEQRARRQTAGTRHLGLGIASYADACATPAPEDDRTAWPVVAAGYEALRAERGGHGDGDRDRDQLTFAAGTHVCAAEVDEETGEVVVRSYVAVDDVGTDGDTVAEERRLHGGIAQGVGQALFEEAGATPRPTTVPAPADLPSWTLGHPVVAGTARPACASAGGDAGAVAATPAVMNAVVDALAPVGVVDVPLPASPQRVWRAIEEGRRAG